MKYAKVPFSSDKSRFCSTPLLNEIDQNRVSSPKIRLSETHSRSQKGGLLSDGRTDGWKDFFFRGGGHSETLRRLAWPQQARSRDVTAHQTVPPPTAVRENLNPLLPQTKPRAQCTPGRTVSSGRSFHTAA